MVTIAETGIAIWNVDTQGDFMWVKGKLPVPGAGGITGNLVSIFRAAEEKGVPILGSADDHNEKSAEFTRNGGVFPDHCMRGTPGQLNIPGTFLDDGRTSIVRWDGKYSTGKLDELFAKPQVILTKDDNDVFTNPYIGVLLDRIPSGTIIFITGVATEYCVRCAGVGLANYNAENGKRWELALVEDAVKEIAHVDKVKTLDEFRELGIAFVPTNHALSHIRLTSQQTTDALRNSLRTEVRHKGRVTG